MKTIEIQHNTEHLIPETVKLNEAELDAVIARFADFHRHILPQGWDSATCEDQTTVPSKLLDLLSEVGCDYRIYIRYTAGGARLVGEAKHSGEEVWADLVSSCNLEG